MAEAERGLDGSEVNVGKDAVVKHGKSMRVRLRFLGMYSVLTGKKEDIVEVPVGTTAYEFLNILSERYGPSFKNQVMDEKGKLRSDCRFFLGEKEISRSQLDSEVTDEDATLFFLSGVEGGSPSPRDTDEEANCAP